MKDNASNPGHTSTNIEAPGDRTVIEPGAGRAPERGKRFYSRNLPPALDSEYVIDHEISTRGAEADVLCVRRRSDGELRVAKLYRAEVDPERARARIARLEHAKDTHVVHVYKRDESAGVWYELMEYCVAGSLVELVAAEGPRLPVELVRDVAGQVLDAVLHVHAEPLSIIHRDVKPGNVLVRSREPLDLVLTDFGLATVLEASVIFASASGTPPYAPPEAAFGTITRKLDWWSVGVMLVEFLTGRHPFRPAGGEDPARLVATRVATEDVPLDGVDDERLWLLCAGLTTRDPEHRWDDAQVREWLAGESPEITRTTAAESPRHLAPVSFPALDGSGRTSYRDPAQLAAALGSNWAAGMEIVGNEASMRREHRQLREFLDGLRPGAGESILLSSEPVELRLTRVCLELDPDARPVFRGVELSTDVLRERAAASPNDPDAARFLADLLAMGILNRFDDPGAGRPWAALEDSWAENAVWLDDWVQQPPAGARLDADTAEVDRAQLRARILGLLLDDAAAEQLRGEAVAPASDEVLKRAPWLAARLAQVQEGPEPARSIYVVLLRELERRAWAAGETERKLAALPAVPRPDPPAKRERFAAGDIVGAALGWSVPVYLISPWLVNKVTGASQAANDAGKFPLAAALIAVPFALIVGTLIASRKPMAAAIRHRAARSAYERQLRASERRDREREAIRAGEPAP